jgi:hypothetical protein
VPTTKPKPIPGLNASVVEAAERNRLAGHIERLQQRKPFSKTEDEDFQRLFQKYREDAEETPPEPPKPKATERPRDLEQRCQEIIREHTKERKPHQQASREVRELMHEVIIAKLARGVTVGGIMRGIVDEWHYSPRGAQVLLAKARQILAARGLVRRRELRATAGMRLDEAFQVAQAADDVAGMVRAVEAFAKLHGLNAATEMKITGQGGPAFVPPSEPRASVELPPEVAP